MNPKDMKGKDVLQWCCDWMWRKGYHKDQLPLVQIEAGLPAYKELLRRLDEADALRKENEELKAQNLLIRGDNADLLANADAYSFNISNMHTKMLQLLEENVELRKDKDKLLKDYAELKVNAALLVACDDALESLAAEEAKESEASHE